MCITDRSTGLALPEKERIPKKLLLITPPPPKPSAADRFCLKNPTAIQLCKKNSFPQDEELLAQQQKKPSKVLQECLHTLKKYGDARNGVGLVIRGTLCDGTLEKQSIS